MSTKVTTVIGTPVPYNQIQPGVYQVVTGGQYVGRDVINQGATMIVLDDPSDTNINTVKTDYEFVRVAKATIEQDA